MDLNEKEIDEKIKKGWIQVLMTFEVMGTSKEIAESTLREHIERLEKEDYVIVLKESFFDVEEIEIENKKLFSNVCEVEGIVRNFEDLVNLVLYYGPSSCEILKPEKIELDMGNAQNILNTLGGIMHRLSELTGGIVVKRVEKPEDK